MQKITKKVVVSAEPQQKSRIIWDTEIKGFGLLILPSGVKSYVYQYRTQENRSRRTTIGQIHKLTAEQARRKALEFQNQVMHGADPLAEKQANRKAIRVTQLLDLYLESSKFLEKAGSTQAVDRGRINGHLKPTLGSKSVKLLTAEDVRRAFIDIRAGNTARDIKTGSRGRSIVRGGEGAARMAVRLFRAIMKWAIDERLATANPARDVSVGSDGKRDTIMRNADDYASLFRALEKMENEKRIRPAHADAIRVIALTGARRGEIASLVHSNIDLQKGIITLPPIQHKTGRKTGKPRIIGLPAAAQAIISRQPRGKPADYVFVPSKGSGAVSLSKAWSKVREEAGLPEGIGLHGLRHSLASHMAMQGAEAAEIMTALGHSQLSTAQKYVHWAQDARSGLAERAASIVTAGMAGAMGKDSTENVVPIKKVEK
jgi:integrase